eukprot:TRINITY_DN3349_c0_g1_i3.p3 TRINITY_DN3349_c0_g1~~TRINITY_DN3349_c0_g1_i3.p3  ORF type:complete len:114 (-),score=23.02 TRINITY_DN3349_c0_g1_i3:120-461(-)
MFHSDECSGRMRNGMRNESKCVNSIGKSNGLGPLQKGLLVRTDLCVCRRLLQQKSVLHYLGQYRAFEVVVGLNGRVWVSADDMQNVLLVKQCVEKCERLSDGMVERWIDSVCK